MVTFFCADVQKVNEAAKFETTNRDEFYLIKNHFQSRLTSENSHELLALSHIHSSIVYTNHLYSLSLTHSALSLPLSHMDSAAHTQFHNSTHGKEFSLFYTQIGRFIALRATFQSLWQ